ncbi:MAG: helical backbone metal receptor [Deltaproteobacteria bacterium]
MIAFVLWAVGAVGADEAPSVPPQWLSAARPKKLERIVTVAPALTELLFAIGVGDRVVGVSRYDDFPAEVKALPKVGGFLDPNVEAIVALRPDLVVANANAGNRAHLERVAKLGVPVYVVPGNTFADIFHANRAVGAVFGGAAEKKARALNAELTATVKSLSAKSKGKPRTKTLVIYAYNPMVVGGPGSFVDHIIEVAGGDNIAKSGSEYPTYSVEHVLESAPDVIIDATEVATEDPPWTNWTAVPAVKNGRVHRVTMGGLMRPGPRIVEGLKRMYGYLHPRAR